METLISRKRKSSAASSPRPLADHSKKVKTQKTGKGSSTSSSACAHDVRKVCVLLAKLIDSGVVSDHAPVFYKKKTDKWPSKDGKITRAGILCSCCGNLFFLSKFEAHAGSGLHRPTANMFLLDGRSLYQCEQGVESGLQGTCISHDDDDDDGHDNVCKLCGDGGQLMLCESCPSAFHANCLHLDGVPRGDWHCSSCRCGECGSGKDSHTQYIEGSASSMIICAHCQTPFHRSCVKLIKGAEEAEGPWLCSKACQGVFTKLRQLVGCVNALDGGLSWMLIRSSKEDNKLPKVAKETRRFEKQQLSGALKLLLQCFNPIKDHETGIDVLAQMVFNRKSHLRRLDCSGFYTMLLHKGEQLVSVATIRVHGNKLAEMPFIGTSYKFQRQGMCKAVMQVLESTLYGAGVYKLIIPSVEELVGTWTRSFQFKSMSQQEQKQVKAMDLLSFPGTTLLHKCLPDHPAKMVAGKAKGGSLPRVKKVQLLSVVIERAFSSAQPMITCH